MEHPHPRTSRLYHALLNIRFRIQDTALFQLQARGFAASDVRHIVLTHLDFDHADGIEDFPQAPVHVLAREREAAERRRWGFIARRRYRPAQFDAVCDWRTYAAGGEPWFGFEAVRALEGLPPEILMVQLPGHTWGHAGVAIDTGAGWILNAGDAYFYRGEMDVERPHCSPRLAAYQALMEVDRGKRLANQRMLCELKRRTKDTCASSAHTMLSSSTRHAGPPAHRCHDPTAIEPALKVIAGFEMHPATASLQRVRHRPPEIAHLAVDADVDLFEMPAPLGMLAHGLDALLRSRWRTSARTAPPEPRGPGADVNAAFVQEVPDVPERRGYLTYIMTTSRIASGELSNPLRGFDSGLAFSGEACWKE